ncbi:MAG: PepSY-associated TM helix domain-containing protein [Colwellia polaris]|uniref:PepSY-associated TM helix domain-containing protein n=1 Tax=Colwellia polaris TaxID=326537 RepID=UPI001E2C4493|nr:PepSY-associated TM helix domain-containing protein [Colwellia polaris]
MSHKIHKWLMLFIGVQFVIWSVTGAYMVFFDIDYIHGDSLVVAHQKAIKPENLTYATAKLFKKYPDAKNLSVGLLVDREVYRFKIAKQQFIIDASNGEKLSPLNKSTAIEVAKYHYAGKEDVLNAKLILANPEFGLSARHLPVWQVDFDHFSAPALFISANNGKVVSKRHRFWYIFDWMFRLHIMDYGDEENAGNWLLFFIAILAIFAVFSGLVLTYFKAIKPRLNTRKTLGKSKKKRPSSRSSVGGKS